MLLLSVPPVLTLPAASHLGTDRASDAISVPTDAEVHPPSSITLTLLHHFWG